MVTFNDDIPAAPGSEHLREKIGRFPAAIGLGTDLFVSCRPRMKEIGRLRCKSDAELTAMGLKREEIARYVYRDMLSL